MTYTIIVPCYNEEKIIEKNITILYNKIKELKPLNLKIKLVILNDGSTDNTHNIACKLINKYKKIGYIRYDYPSRRENLLEFIDLHVDTEYVCFLDCDLATDLIDLEPLLINLKYYNIVSGSRYLSSSKIKRSLDRKIISYLFNNLIRIGFKSKVRDHECGFKCFKTDTLRQLLYYTDYGIEKKGRKMFWDSEMWVYSQLIGLKTLEIPVNWKAGRKSALRFRSELPLIWYIIKFWFKIRFTKWWL